MKTEIIKVNPDNINPVNIKIATKKIQEGGLVAFPTETVYGLGVDVFNPQAVAKIFEAKNRPLEDPLIVHIAQREDLFKLAKEENKDKYGDFNVKSLGPGDDLAACAANLFSILREFDKEGVDIIIAEGVKEKGLGLAIMDRLRKASGG